MSYRTGLEPLSNSDMSTLRVFRSTTPSKNSILTQIVTGIVFHNPPAFTGLALKIYSDNAGAPGVLIATSTNTWSRAAIHTAMGTTDNYGVVWVYYNFDDVTVRTGLTYHIVLNGASNYGSADVSTAGGNSYIGWRIGYPDEVYEDLDYVDQVKWYFDNAYLGKRL